jgi:transketolase
LQEASSPAKVILVGTGSEVQHCFEAAKLLEASGVPTRVISMPSWFLFEKQTDEYKQSVFTKGTPTLAVEAATSFGWAKYSDAQVCIDHFGVSGPAPELFKEFGFTAENVAKVAKELIG